MAEYLSTDPNAGKPTTAPQYLSTDPNAGAPAAPALADGLDTSSREAFTKSVNKSNTDSAAQAKKNEGINLPPGLREMGANAEALTTLATGTAGTVAGSAAGLLHKINPLTKNVTDADSYAAKVRDSMTYEPRTKQGRELMEKIGGFMDSSKLAGMNPAEQITLGSLPRAGVALPKGAPKEKVAPKAATPVGEGAEKAVNELQRQRNVAGGADKVADLAGQSAHEAAVLERDKVTTPLRQQAFNSGERIDAAPVSKLIDEIEKKNPDPSIRGQLDKVREILKNATQSSQGSVLPAAGSKVSVDQLKAMQGQSSKMPVAMADEVRQSIKRMIDSKDGSGKPLDKHTQELLGAIRDKLVDGAPANYKKYLDEYTRLSKPLDEFKAPGSARDKVTTDAKAFHLLNAADKQNMMQAAFKSETPGRALSELVRDTSHSPEAAKGVRVAYTDWLTQSDDSVKMQPSIGGMTKRWEQTRDAVKSSKLMDESHIAAMDKIMDDLRASGQKHGVKKVAASVAGWFAGSTVGHPFVAARAARETLGSGSAAAGKAMDNAIMQIAADPAGAKLLAAPPTSANIEKIRVMLPADLATTIAPTVAREEQSRKRRDPFSMQPSL